MPRDEPGVRGQGWGGGERAPRGRVVIKPARLLPRGRRLRERDRLLDFRRNFLRLFRRGGEQTAEGTGALVRFGRWAVFEREALLDAPRGHFGAHIPPCAFFCAAFFGSDLNRRKVPLPLAGGVASSGSGSSLDGLSLLPKKPAKDDALAFSFLGSVEEDAA